LVAVEVDVGVGRVEFAGSLARFPWSAFVRGDMLDLAGIDAGAQMRGARALTDRQRWRRLGVVAESRILFAVGGSA